jgi:hypothetical protein
MLRHVLRSCEKPHKKYGSEVCLSVASTLPRGDSQAVSGQMSQTAQLCSPRIQDHVQARILVIATFFFFPPSNLVGTRNKEGEG